MSDFDNTHQQNQSNDVPQPRRRIDPTTAILMAIQKKPEHIKMMSADKKTPEFIKKAIQLNPQVFRFLNEDEKTIDICLHAVSIDGMLLEAVLDQTDKFPVVCRALEQNYEALQFVHHQTPDLCEQVINARPDAVRFMKIQDAGCYYLAVYKDPNNIKYVPSAYQSEELLKLVATKAANLEQIANPTPEMISMVANSINGDMTEVDKLQTIISKLGYLKLEYSNEIAAIKYNENIKVLIHDVVEDQMYYTNFTKNLKNMIFNYINSDLGDRGLKAAETMFKKNKTDVKAIEDDPTFTSGLFVIEKGEKHYELWEKKVEGVTYPGVWPITSSYEVMTKTVKLLKTYRLMKMQFQQYVQ